MALSAAEKTAIKRALLFYGSYLRRTHASNILSNDDLLSAFQNGDIGGSDYATKRANLEQALTSIIAPSPDSNTWALIEAA